MTNEEMELQIKQILESNRFVSPYSQAQREQLGQYISYRCLKDMSKVVDEYSRMKKDDLMQLVRSFEPFRMAVRSIIFHVLLHFDLNKFQFDLVGEASLWDEDDKAADDGSGTLPTARIYSDDEGADLVNVLMVRAEFTHYRHLCESKEEEYSWIQYLDDLMNSEELITELNHAVIDGILQLDFRDMTPWRELYRMLSAQYDSPDDP